METILVYTDGSCLHDKVSAWAFVAFKDGKEIHRASGILTGEVCQTRNIGSELFACIKAVSWVKKNGHKVLIIHDLEGISLWASGKWKRNNKYTKEYYDFMQKNKEVVAGFQWVKSHANTHGNILVDELAGKTLKDYCVANKIKP